MQSNITATAAWNGIEPHRVTVNPFDVMEVDDDDDELTQAWCKSLELQAVCANRWLGRTPSIHTEFGGKVARY